MLHKYKVIDTGTIFFFDNKTNALFDKNKKQLSQHLGNREQRQDKNSESNELYVEKTNKPSEIRIVLGHKCNFSCGYCVQSDVGDHAKPEKGFKQEVKNLSGAKTLISNLRKLDLSILEQIEFWGGETLLYWNQVKELMAEFDEPGFDFVIITNGVLFRKEHLDFLLNIKGRTTITFSHDGPMQEKNRGKDYLSTMVEHFRAMEDFPEKIRCEMQCTITKKYFNFIETNDFFRDFFKKHDLKPIPLVLKPVWVYDKLSERHAVNNVLPNYGNELKRYLDKQINQFKRLKRVESEEMLESELFHITINDDDNNGVLALSGKMRSELDYTPSTVCGMHQNDKLVVDINGNIRSCQNVGTDIYNGNILDFEDSDSVRLKGIHPNKHQDKCHSCPVFLLCLSGCPLDFNQEFFDVNCNISMTHNTTVLHSAFKLLFGGDVEWLGAEV